jgi:hypothetical protein
MASMLALKKQDLLRRAAKLLGREKLAQHLNVPLTLLDDWLRGDVTMGDAQLLPLARVLDGVSREKKA